MLTGIGSNGSMVGYWQPANGTAFAYDAATSTYYTFGSAGSWAQGVNANGYVVGGDGANGDGFVWSESTGSYTQIPGLAAAQAISNNNQLIAGLTQAAAPTPRSTTRGAPGGHLLGRRGNGREQQRRSGRRHRGQRLQRRRRTNLARSTPWLTFPASTTPRDSI